MRKTKGFLLGICLLLVGAYTVDARFITVSDHPQVNSNDVRIAVAETYTAQIGVRETLGANDSPEIREYLKITSVKVPAAWCAAFVSYCYTKNAVPNPRSAWSPNYFVKSHLIDPKTTPPLQADVFGVYYANLGRIAHIGFIDRWPRDGEYFISVEGNTNDNGSREGNGVYKKRSLKRRAAKVARFIYPDMQLLTKTNKPCEQNLPANRLPLSGLHTNKPSYVLCMLENETLRTTNLLPLLQMESYRSRSVIPTLVCKISSPLERPTTLTLVLHQRHREAA